jgi:small subunit ribosomal protein S6
MANYEAMFIVNSNVNEEQKKEITAHLNDAILKNQGEVVSAAVWSEKRKFAYPIKKFQEGIYYLINFKAEPSSILKLKQGYKLNESIIRLLITRGE